LSDPPKRLTVHTLATNRANVTDVISFSEMDDVIQRPSVPWPQSGLLYLPLMEGLDRTVYGALV
jgi:hypothetical protein